MSQTKYFVKIQDLQNINVAIKNIISTISDLSFPEGFCSAISSISSAQYLTPILDGNVKYINNANLTEIPNYAFDECVYLEDASFLNVTHIASSAFRNCKRLKCVTLLNSSVAQLDDINAFEGTPFFDFQGSICVPASLFNNYKTASNWSIMAPRLVSI